MATNNGKPLGDGRSGAAGNGAATKPMHLGGSPRQQMGNGRNPQSVPDGGPVLKLDPPGDRGGMIGTVAGTDQRRPFVLGTSPSSSEETDDEDGAPVGELPTADDEP